MKIVLSRRLCPQAFGLAALSSSLAITGSAALAQDVNGGGERPTIEELSPDAGKSQEERWIEDFIHSVLTARVDWAHANAQALVESGISDADLYRLIDELERYEPSDLDDALVRAARVAELEDIAGQLQRRINKGRVDVARDPDEIERHIRNLTGSARGRLMAEEALRAAGEYAVPQLLDVLVNSDRSELKARVESVLSVIGRQAVTPLSVALPHLDAVSQERVARILGDIGHFHALPALYTVMNSPNATPAVRQAAQSAYAELGGDPNVTGADLWLALAELYWGEARSLIAWPSEDANNVWAYESSIGLTALPVPTSIFSEVMVMRSTEDALRAAPDSLSGLSLWIAGNFRRSDQLADETDPTYGDDRRAPLFYAVAAGPDAAQLVLDRANRDLNARLARHAIRALSGTAGDASLWVDGSQPTPLVAALEFPERRVRYDAALALGKALPTETFFGSDRVVPVLASAIRTGDRRFAAVLAEGDEDQRTLAANLRDMGFTVLPPHGSYEEVRGDLAEAPGVDLFVILAGVSDLPGTVASIQADPRIAASPVLIISPSSQVSEWRSTFEGNARVGIVRLGLDNEQMTTAINNLLATTTGELMTGEEAANYAAESLRTLRDIAVKDTAAFDITRAESALVEALQTFTGDLRLTAAQTLSWLDTRGAQSALLDAALAEADEATRIAFLDAAANSAKRYGSYATDRQVAELINLVRTSAGPVATAAAQAHGALNLPPSNTVPLILSE